VSAFVPVQLSRYVSSAKILSELLAGWHNYRTTVIVSVVLIYLAIRIKSFRRYQGHKQSPSPLLGTPTPNSTTIEKSGWLDDKPRPTVAVDVVQQQSSTRERTIDQKEPITRSRPAPKRVTGSRVVKRSSPQMSDVSRVQPLVFFSSLTGTTEKHAANLVKDLQRSFEGESSNIIAPQIHDLSYIDYDDFFVSPPKQTTPTHDVCYFYLLLLPTYNIDTVLNNFLSHLQETHNDFRIDTGPLSGLAGYSVFGFGDREGWKTEEQSFCSQAIEVDKWMAKLTSRKRAFPLGMGDVKSDATERLEEWREGVAKVLLDIATNGGLGEGVPGSGDAMESDEEDVDDNNPEIRVQSQRPSKQRKTQQKTRVGDLEDLGGSASSRISPLQIDSTTSSIPSSTSPPLQEMVPVSSPTYTALTKQGYAIVGSHSGVKICRWTKSALRGRGSCYKYSFYGIKSHLCMETTPSLSCSNKCVFCWRHGTNPVGTTWRWKVDPPEMILDGAKEAHVKKIKMMRGVPGVRAERFQEAMRIRHCALSLVGEPIFYPHINEFVALLHKQRISSFLVCNAQHPDQLEALKVVTQLYVSIDASNRDSLRKVDRPLHRDFWERFLRCLDILREKRFRMRTVFRLTLVKGFNIEDEAEGYAALVERGLPCFVEVKGVTYCGTSTSSSAGLTMQNVPFYEEVVAFVEALNAALERRGLRYGIAAEHVHSCCVLIGSKRFLKQSKWHTLIDYEKFFELLERGKGFSPEDYMGPPTPEWANWGNGGFDPADQRVDRKGRPKEISSAIVG